MVVWKERKGQESRASSRCAAECDSPAVKRFLPPQGHLGGLFTMIELLVVTAEDIYHISPQDRGAFLSTRRDSVLTVGESRFNGTKVRAKGTAG